jgi:hypothetical protein
MSGGDLNVSDQQMLAHTLGLCERVGRRFTLRELVALISDERPELMVDFPEIWGALIRHKRVRVYQIGEPNVYEIVRSSRR